MFGVGGFSSQIILYRSPARNINREEGDITIPAAERIKFLENEE